MTRVFGSSIDAIFVPAKQYAPRVVIPSGRIIFSREAAPSNMPNGTVSVPSANSAFFRLSQSKKASFASFIDEGIITEIIPLSAKALSFIEVTFLPSMISGMIKSLMSPV